MTVRALTLTVETHFHALNHGRLCLLENQILRVETKNLN